MNTAQLKRNYNRLNAKDFDTLFNSFFQPNNSVTRPKEFAPAVDVFELENSFEIEAVLPGMKKSEIDVELKDDLLIISGNRVNERTKETGQVQRIETQYGAFKRVLAVPEHIDGEKIEAHYNEGILKLTFPKKKREEMFSKVNIQ